MREYIDITPSWGQWGNIFYRFAISGERRAVDTLHRDFALAMSAAEAFKVIQGDLTEEQRKTAHDVLSAEMKKQGFEL